MRNPFESTEQDNDEAYVDGKEEQRYRYAGAVTVEHVPETERNGNFQSTGDQGAFEDR